MVLYWLFSKLVFDLNCSSLATWVCRMVMLTAHLSRCYASHCFLNYYDFLRFYLCWSLNFFFNNNLACLYFSSSWDAFTRVLLWKSPNFLRSLSWMIYFWAGCSSFNCLTKCYLLTLSNFYFEICSFFKGSRVLFIRFDLLNALAFVFSNCYISYYLLFSAHREASLRLPTAYWWPS